MQKLLFILLVFYSFSLFAQNGPNNSIGARSNGVSNASVAFTDINSLFNNQAGLANLEQIGFLFSFEESYVNPYSENFGGGFAIPTSSGTFGMNMIYFGASDINQIKIGLAYARKLTEKLSAGIQFDMVSTQIAPYDRSQLFSSREDLFTFEIGLQYQLLDNLLLGIHLHNPAKMEIIENEFLPRVIRTGATYFFSKKLMLHVEIEKDFDFPFVLKSGMEWEMVNNLWFRIGGQINPTTINVGTGYQFKKGFRFDLACYYQHGLNLTSSGILGSSGLVPCIGLGFDFIGK